MLPLVCLTSVLWRHLAHCLCSESASCYSPLPYCYTSGKVHSIRLGTGDFAVWVCGRYTYPLVLLHHMQLGACGLAHKLHAPAMTSSRQCHLMVSDSVVHSPVHAPISVCIAVLLLTTQLLGYISATAQPAGNTHHSQQIWAAKNIWATN